MKGYTAARALIVLAEVGISALLILSALPALSGGLDVRIEKDLTVSQSGAVLVLEGRIDVSSRMPWDIGIGYDVLIGSEELPVFSGSYSTTVVRDATTSIEIDMEVPVVNAALYLLGSGPGKPSGSLALPFTVSICGDYINGVLKIELSVDIDMKVEASEGTLERDADGTHLACGAVLSPAGDLPFGNSSITIGFGDTVVGAFSYAVSRGEGTVSLTLDSDDGDIIGALRSLVGPDGTLCVVYGGASFELNAAQTAALIGIIGSLMENAEVT